MKATGIIRKVDELGRIVIPIELRRALDIEEKDSLEIYVNNGSIMLKKIEESCVFCGSMNNVRKYKEKNICQKCIDELKEA